MVDGFPRPVCHFKRARGGERFKGEADYGYCASKNQTYYGFKGTVLGDKGYLSERLRQELLAEGVVLQTPVRANMTDLLPSSRRTQLNRLRRRIETTIGQLTEQFHIQRTWARGMWSLTNRLNRKLLAHSLAVWFNRLDNRPPYN